MYDYLIVGAGLFGSIFAHEAASRGKKCLVIDKRSHVGGNIFCEKIEEINVHKYGAHIFHTSDEDVWKYLNKFASFNNYVNSPIALYNGKVYNLPFNMNTFSRLWDITTPAEAITIIESQKKEYFKERPANLEEQALSLVGKDIYEMFIKGYTEKQWGKDAKDLPAFIIKRLPVRFTYNNNYFDDCYQGIPKGGYTGIIDKLLEGIDVELDVNYFQNREFYNQKAVKTVFTGMIDEFYNYEYGVLEYRSLSFEHQTLEIDDFQGNAVVNYNEREIPFTRIIEHKHFEFGKQSKTIITREYPKEWKKGDEPYYPVNDDKNTALYQQYRSRAEKERNLIFGGRLAEYKYYDMDDVVKAALRCVHSEFR